MSNVSHKLGLIDQISRLMAEKLLVETSSPEEDLLSSGVIDSFSLIQLLVNLEEQFGVQISLEELEIDDFRSIQSIARLIENYQHVSNGTASAARG